MTETGWPWPAAVSSPAGLQSQFSLHVTEFRPRKCESEIMCASCKPGP